MKNKISKKRGFTLIEVMISTAIFTLIMTMGIGAVLSSNTVHKKSQNLRSILDNLNFIMEDMSRNIRLGSNYRCIILDGTPNPFIPPYNISGTPVPADCSSGDGIVFTGVDGKNIAYLRGSNEVLLKFKEGDPAPQQLTTNDVNIDVIKSGFTVFGSAPGPADTVQPRVTIRLAGVINSKNLSTPFNLYTSVSQRLLDR